MTNIPPPKQEITSNILRGAHATLDMTWEDMSQILGVPAGTLWNVAHGRPVPRKWWARLGIRRHKDLNAMSTKELRWALENREEA